MSGVVGVVVAIILLSFFTHPIFAERQARADVIAAEFAISSDTVEYTLAYCMSIGRITYLDLAEVNC